jgi:hypothetical protein
VDVERVGDPLRLEGARDRGRGLHVAIVSHSYRV